MNFDPSHIEVELNALMLSSQQRPYKNRESINWIKEMFTKVWSIGIKMNNQYPGFPVDKNIPEVIEELTQLLYNKTNNKKLEWSFDHYTDLFKFKAEALLANILSELNTPQKNTRSINTIRTELLSLNKTGARKEQDTVNDINGPSSKSRKG